MLQTGTLMLEGGLDASANGSYDNLFKLGKVGLSLTAWYPTFKERADKRLVAFFGGSSVIFQVADGIGIAHQYSLDPGSVRQGNMGPGSFFGVDLERSADGYVIGVGAGVTISHNPQPLVFKTPLSW